jgi:hypothetical protein
VNIRRDRAQVCGTEKPAATEIAPNESAYAPVASAIPKALRMTRLRVAAQMVHLRSMDDR